LYQHKMSNHPRHGALACDRITFKPAHREDLKLVVLVPGARVRRVA